MGESLILWTVALSVAITFGHTFPQRGQNQYLPVANEVNSRHKSSVLSYFPHVPDTEPTNLNLQPINPVLRTSYTAVPGIYTSPPAGPVLLPSPLPNIQGTQVSQLSDLSNNFNLSEPVFSATLPGEFTATITIGPYSQKPPVPFEEGSHNKTDVIIINTQKKAYILPKRDSKDISSATVQHFYKNRHNLNNTLTINQFLFFIAPQNVNFLNKVV